jgi:hypothetical protein
MRVCSLTCACVPGVLMPSVCFRDRWFVSAICSVLNGLMADASCAQRSREAHGKRSARCEDDDGAPWRGAGPLETGGGGRQGGTNARLPYSHLTLLFRAALAILLQGVAVH